MLEAYYTRISHAGSGAGLNPTTLRLIVKIAFGLGGLMFAGLAYWGYSDPGSWTNRQTGAPVTETGGMLIAALFTLGALGFWGAAAAVDRLPLSVNGRMIDPGGTPPAGLAWRMTPTGLHVPAWHAGIIPWSSFAQAKWSIDGSGGAALHFYFRDQEAAARYLEDAAAADWHPGFAAALPVGATNVTAAQVHDWLKGANPALLTDDF
jgi:hypothetical protein